MRFYRESFNAACPINMMAVDGSEPALPMAVTRDFARCGIVLPLHQYGAKGNETRGRRFLP
jgi:hypothetical protein